MDIKVCAFEGCVKTFEKKGKRIYCPECAEKKKARDIKQWHKDHYQRNYKRVSKMEPLGYYGAKKVWSCMFKVAT